MTTSAGPPEQLTASIWLCAGTESIHGCLCGTNIQTMLMLQFILAIAFSFAVLRGFFAELG